MGRLRSCVYLDFTNLVSTSNQLDTQTLTRFTPVKTDVLPLVHIHDTACFYNDNINQDQAYFEFLNFSAALTMVGLLVPH